MNPQEIIQKIICLPKQFRSLKTKSIRDLLEESGYCKTHSEISIDLLNTHLTRNASLVSQWLEYSSDKRVSSGWYFYKNEQPSCRVGYRSKNESIQHEYEDETYACAVFIKNEIEELRKSIPSGQ